MAIPDIKPCQTGYNCVWGKHTGVNVTCSLPRCHMFVGESVTEDFLSKQGTHRKVNVVKR